MAASKALAATLSDSAKQSIARLSGISNSDGDEIEKRIAALETADDAMVCSKCYSVIFGRFDRAGYWKANLVVIFALLAIWAVVSFGCSILFIEQLNRFSIGRLPVGFWIGQQGSIFVFVVLIFVYAFVMDRLDRRFGVREHLSDE